MGMRRRQPERRVRGGRRCVAAAATRPAVAVSRPWLGSGCETCSSGRLASRSRRMGGEGICARPGNSQGGSVPSVAALPAWGSREVEGPRREVPLRFRVADFAHCAGPRCGFRGQVLAAQTDRSMQVRVRPFPPTIAPPAHLIHRGRASLEQGRAGMESWAPGLTNGRLLRRQGPTRPRPGGCARGRTARYTLAHSAGGHVHHETGC